MFLGGEEEEEHQGGMPYSYNYDAGLSSKTETADDQGNVEGSYTYVDGAGVKRTVTYTVKGNKGVLKTRRTTLGTKIRTNSFFIFL